MPKEETKNKTEEIQKSKKLIFNCVHRQNMSLDDVIDDIARYMTEDATKKYRVIIGTDSPGSKKVEFITAIVVHRVGRGGRYWWHKSATKEMPSRKVRILSEVLQSLSIAELAAPKLRAHKLLVSYLQKLGLKYRIGIPLEIHVDVGEHGATRNMIQEVVGMVRGNGFEPKIKPESFCASVVADRHT
jgi:predicted RNase H-related nuclease YkuK (DUF458 family)